MMIFSEQKYLGRIICFTMTIKVEVWVAECQICLTVQLNADLSEHRTRTGHNVMWSRQLGQMSGGCECSPVKPEYLPNTMGINLGYLFYQMITGGRVVCIDCTQILIYQELFMEYIHIMSLRVMDIKVQWDSFESPHLHLLLQVAVRLYN